MTKLTSSCAAIALLLCASYVFLDSRVWAYERICLADGYTVVFVNGIMTSRDQAIKDREALNKKFVIKSGRSDVTFLTGYNQTHAGGRGDELKSVAQTYLTNDKSYLNDFDLKTILMELAPQLHTQKVLLVGHSQGTFYTNAMYNYLIAHGVSPSSIAVYNLATPAASVAGGGAYTTSSYDKVIEYVRELDAKVGAPQPLPANINIPLPYDERDDEWGGHHFQSDYLEGAPGQIVRDMQAMLTRLVSSGADSSSPCFEPPTDSVAYKTQALAFAALDATYSGAQSVGGAVASVGKALGAAVGSSLASVLPSLPQLTSDNAATAMRAQPLGTTARGGGIDGLAELTADRKANAEFAAAQRAAEEEALKNAPRIEAVKPKSLQIDAQAGAAALAFLPEAEAAEAAPVQEPVPAAPATPDNSYQPGFGGGGVCVINCPSANAPVAAAPAPAAPAPTAPELTLASPTDETTFATTSVTFAGTATADATITATGDATGSATADGSGDWSMTLSLANGTSTVSFVAQKDGLDSVSITRTIGVALPPPGAPVVTASACAYSLASFGCVLPVGTTTIAWANADNAESYYVYVDGVLQESVSATSAIVTLAPDATSTIEVVAANLLSGMSTSTAIEIRSVPHALRINEIAWAGTVSNPADQWLELRNGAGFALDLAHITLVAADGAPYVPLSGSIAGPDASGHPGYYLIERRDQAVLSVGADLIAAFDLLSASGEELQIAWWDGTATTTIDATPAVATCGGWCAGSAAHALGTSAQPGLPPSWALESMERIGEDGTLAASWQSNDAYQLFATDVGAMLVYGTPGRENSHGWPVQGWYCGSVYLPSDPAPTFAFPKTCTVLMRFISPSANRYVGFFLGSVGASTLSGAASLGKVLSEDVTLDGAGMASGDPGFVAVWENRSNVGSDLQDFEDYFTGASASGPPHENFMVLPYRAQ